MSDRQTTPLSKTRDVAGILHFLTPQQMAEEIVRLDSLLCQQREKAGPAAWLQIGVGPLHEGERIPRLTKPAKWNPAWWRFEPLFTHPHCGNCVDGVPGGPDRCSKCHGYSHWDLHPKAHGAPGSPARQWARPDGKEGCSWPDCLCATSDNCPIGISAQPVKDLSASASPATKEQQ